MSNRYDTVYNLLNRVDRENVRGSSNEKVNIPYLKKTRNETKNTALRSARLCHLPLLTKKTDNGHWNKIKQKEHNMKATKKLAPTNSNKEDKSTESKKENTVQLVGRHRSSFDNSFENEETTCINDHTHNNDDNDNQTFYQHLFSSQYKFSYFSPVSKN